MKRILTLLFVGLVVLAPVAHGAVGGHKSGPKNPQCPDLMPGHHDNLVTIHYTYRKSDRKVHCVSIVPSQTILHVGGWVWFVNDGPHALAKPPFVLVLDASHHEDAVPFQKSMLELKSPGPRDQFKVTMAADCKPHRMQFVFLASSNKADTLAVDCPDGQRVLGNPQVVVDGSGD